MRCFDALCDLYAMLGEDDMVFGLWQVGAPGKLKKKNRKMSGTVMS